jgi:hypothetical protein
MQALRTHPAIELWNAASSHRRARVNGDRRVGGRRAKASCSQMK